MYTQGSSEEEVSGDTMYREGFRDVICTRHHVGWGEPVFTDMHEKTRGLENDE